MRKGKIFIIVTILIMMFMVNTSNAKPSFYEKYTTNNNGTHDVVEVEGDNTRLIGTEKCTYGSYTLQQR